MTWVKAYCDRPPTGWECSQPPGHGGHCSARWVGEGRQLTITGDEVSSPPPPPPPPPPPKLRKVMLQELDLTEHEAVRRALELADELTYEASDLPREERPLARARRKLFGG